MSELQRGHDPLPHATSIEALGIVAICFGWFIAASLQSTVAWTSNGDVRSVIGDDAFNDGRMLGLIVVELILGAVAGAVLAARRYPLHTLIPRPSWSGVLAGAGLYLCVMVLLAIVTPLVPHPLGTPVERMLANAHVSHPTAVVLALVLGTYEEVFLLGYLMRGLRRHGASTAIGVMVLVRLLYHLYQGPLGALSVTVFGIVLGVWYQRTGRLFPAVAAHIVGDVLPFL